MADDRYWLEQLRKGDKESLRHIYLAYKDRLLTIAMCLLNDPSTAEDCLHDVFVRLADQSKSIRIRDNLKGYLAAAIANRARDLYRLKARQPSQPLDGVDCPDDGVNPSLSCEQTEQSQSLLEALANLPGEQREVIVLHLQGDMTFKAIAGSLDISINTAQSRYRYGIDKLRILLTQGARS